MRNREHLPPVEELAYLALTETTRTNRSEPRVYKVCSPLPSVCVNVASGQIRLHPARYAVIRRSHEIAFVARYRHRRDPKFRYLRVLFVNIW